MSSFAKKTKPFQIDSPNFDQDSDEEIQNWLGTAVKLYKQNCSNSSDVNFLGDKKNRKNRSDNINEKKSKNKLPAAKAFEKQLEETDMQVLIEKFFIAKKNYEIISRKKTYQDYEKQGAIPKRIARENSVDNKQVQIKASKRINSKGGVKKRDQNASTNFLHNKQMKNAEDSQKRDIFKKKESNFNVPLNGSEEILMAYIEKICARPFFYIVPEKPRQTLFLPNGSYYVVPNSPVSHSRETIIFHPESSNENIQISSTMITSPDKNHEGLEESDDCESPSEMNNLEKQIPLSIDSHLNIGPIQVKESILWENTERNCRTNKTHDKILISPEVSPKLLNLPNELAIKSSKLLEQDFEKTDDAGEEEESDNDDEEEELENDDAGEEEESDNDDEEEEELKNDDYEEEEVNENRNSLTSDKHLTDDNLLMKIYQMTESLLMEFTDIRPNTAEKYAVDFFMEQDLEDSATLDEKIENQFNRLVSVLPEVDISKLLQKCQEFKGDKTKELPYIRQLKQNQQLLVEIQSLIPDASPDFLHEQIELLNGDSNAVNELILELLDNQNYPKVSSTESKNRQKLWETYVTNFNARNYELRILTFREWDHRKFSEKDDNLIKMFLTWRYPDVPAEELMRDFISHDRCLTRTCSDMNKIYSGINKSRIGRLSSSGLINEDINEDLLMQLSFIDHEEEIEAYIEQMREKRELEMADARLNEAFLFCSLCASDDIIPSDVVTCPEGHVFCVECIRRYVQVKIGDGIYKFSCPWENCDSFFTLHAMAEILPDNIVSIIVKKQQTEEISQAQIEGLEFCPKCDYAYVPKAEDNIFRCQNSDCLAETCRKCHEQNHIPLRCEEVERSIDVDARKKIEEAMTEELIRRCPSCAKPFVKTDGCNKIVCACGVKICYICNRIVNGYDHFAGNGSTVSGCPLYVNNEELHVRQVVQAGVQTRDEVLQENPNVRVFFDPTAL